ncbi:methyltransferase domain-containing protein [Flavobacteriaceae bacterium TP-CH-4]|uniref:Methyltransferase domain-containing protein n=1 Tax=Pelagihabitans pacificus TaxID=2696054 RepID=A0A967EC35_9FLAO|nr:methyltransferase domain-containing protein [Pelagihabitans pacificus]NHF60856.1 methyltransferase domain-containing protein [Pelagihabitans pacificus]
MRCIREQKVGNNAEPITMEDRPYILGTDQEELYRLGLQHQVWAEEAQRGWRAAGFRAGQILLDLGCGPGYCTKELAFIAGKEGKVIGVDKSKAYIDYVQRLAQLYDLNIEAIASDFDAMQLPPESLDGLYCRWALAWIPNPEEILQKVYRALKPGGKMVIQEYYDWSLLQTEPKKEALTKAIARALKSFKDTEYEIDIGRYLPGMLEALGMRVRSVRPMVKLPTPNSSEWLWPKTFFQSYFPRLIPQGYLNEEEVAHALADLEALEQTSGASMATCLMVEVIAEKV